MGLFDLFIKKKEVQIRTQEPGRKEDAKVVAELRLGEEKYELIKFDLNFKQDLGRKGLPEGGVYGGRMSCVIRGVPGKLLMAWAISPYLKKDGEIRFYNRNRVIGGGTDFLMRFMGAHCLYIHHQVSIRDHIDRTDLVIAPHGMKVGGDEFENNWK